MKKFTINLTKEQREQIKGHTGANVSKLSLIPPTPSEGKTAMKKGPAMAFKKGPAMAFKKGPAMAFKKGPAMAFKKGPAMAFRKGFLFSAE